MTREELLSGPSCLTNALPDEPLFVLRANDELAQEIVYEWAQRYRALKTRDGQDLSHMQTVKYEDAMRVCDQMLLWRKGRRF